MATNGNGMVAVVIPANGRGNTHHVLDDYEDPRRGSRAFWKTACGKDASEWNRAEDQNIAIFMSSGFACQRCLNIII